MQLLSALLLVIATCNVIFAAPSDQTPEELINAFYSASNEKLQAIEKEIVSKINEKNQNIYKEVTSGKKATDLHSFIDDLVDQLLNEAKQIVSKHMQQVNVLLKDTVKIAQENFTDSNQIKDIIEEMKNLSSLIDADVLSQNSKASESYKQTFHAYAQKVEKEHPVPETSTIGSTLSNLFNSVVNTFSFN